MVPGEQGTCVPRVTIHDTLQPNNCTISEGGLTHPYVTIACSIRGVAGCIPVSKNERPISVLFEGGVHIRQQESCNQCNRFHFGSFDKILKIIPPGYCRSITYLVLLRTPRGVAMDKILVPTRTLVKKTKRTMPLYCCAYNL